VQTPWETVIELETLGLEAVVPVNIEAGGGKGGSEQNVAQRACCDMYYQETGYELLLFFPVAALMTDGGWCFVEFA